LAPQSADGRKADHQFENSEKLFRRFAPSDFTDGRLGIDRISASIRFPTSREVKEDPQNAKKSPSWIRSRYGTAADAIDIKCAKTAVPNHGVISVQVGGIPNEIAAGDRDSFDFYPLHDPLEECYAHTLVCPRRTGQTEYEEPPKQVKNKLRQWIFANHELEIEPRTV
jgi:hypothetical protein